MTLARRRSSALRASAGVLPSLICRQCRGDVERVLPGGGELLGYAAAEPVSAPDLLVARP